MAKVIHFEIETKDPEQSIKFYEQVFGWQFSEMEGFDGYWLISAGSAEEAGINGALMMGTEEKLQAVNTLSVTNLDETLAGVERAGGKVTSEKMNVPGVGIFAYCEDSQGVRFGVLQSVE